MDPYSSPYIIPIASIIHSPIPLLRTRQLSGKGAVSALKLSTQGPGLELRHGEFPKIGNPNTVP